MDEELVKYQRCWQADAGHRMKADWWEKVEDAYHHARDLRGEERSRFLNDVCASDGAMRRQLEALLQQDDNPKSLLNRPAVELAAEWPSLAGPPAMLSGTRIEAYEILEPLGSGGMGDVYRARDTQLGRDVAFKVLPEAFADDPERLARFHREAQVLAALNHVNIAQIYGVVESDRMSAIAMELVEGETLQAGLKRGPVPVEEALHIAQQVADALEAAHSRRIVHRDLKPGNIMVAADGTVKVLDFGLAIKAIEPHDADVGMPPSPTSLTKTYSQPHVLIGTAAYMSPEQVQGRRANERSDIWAFGCVVYEMLTGRHPFTGETVTDLLGSILHAEPDWNALPAGVRPGVRAVLQRCLEKDRRRFHAIGDVRVELEDALTAAPAVAIRDVPTWRRGLAWIVAGVFALTTVGMFVAGYLVRSPATLLSRFVVDLPPGVRLPAGAAACPALSPDGRYITFVGISENISRVFLRPTASLSAQPIPGTEDAGECPFWSPDSRFIGFFAGGKVKTVTVSAGTPVPLCDATLQDNSGVWNSGVWNANGVILFSHQGSVHRVDAGGGPCIPIRTPDKSRSEVSHRPVSFLPDGQHFLYVSRVSDLVARSPAFTGDLRVGSLDSSNDTPLLPVSSRVTYSPSGHLLFVRDGALMAQPFDARGLSLSGDIFRVAEGIAYSNGNAAFSVSGNGMLVYRTAVATTSQFLWFDRTGKVPRPVGEPGNYGQFDLSPDGNRIAVSRFEPATFIPNIWLIDLTRGVPQKLTFNLGFSGGDPVWSPNGLQIARDSVKKESFGIVATNASGVGEDTTLLEGRHRVGMEDWSKDGRYIAYVLDDDGTRTMDIFVSPLSGDRKPIKITQTRFYENEPHFSFDGRWIAYGSNESGTWQVYVTSFPELDRRCQVSAGGGSQPRWRQDGKELYYLAADGRLMAVDISAGLKLDCGAAPQTLFDTGLRMNPVIDQYAVTRDGQRFLVLKPQEGAPTPLTVVLNWDADMPK
jgi:serine/threonine protein kinase